MERKPLLTDEELEKLDAMAQALRSIAGNNQPHLRDNLCDEIDRLRELVADGTALQEIRELAEDLNSDMVLMDWAEAIDEGQGVIDKLTLKLADENAETFVDDDDPSDTSSFVS